MAARYTFRRLFLAGLTALLADAVGFAVLMVIDIPVIQDLALTASIGVAVLIFTNLILLPVLLSLRRRQPGRRRAQPARRQRRERAAAASTGCGRCSSASPSGAGRLARCSASALLLAGRRTPSSTQLKIGDLDPGAPELRADSRYNRDNAYITGQLRAVQRHLRGDRQDRRRKAA